MKKAGIFIMMATGAMFAFGQSNTIQASNNVQAQPLMQLHPGGLHQGAKLINTQAQAGRNSVQPVSKPVHTSASIKQAPLAGSSVKLNAGKPISQRDWQAAKQANAGKKVALKAPSALATNKLPAEQMAELKQSRERGPQPGAKIINTNPVSTVQPVGNK